MRPAAHQLSLMAIIAPRGRSRNADSSAAKLLAGTRNYSGALVATKHRQSQFSPPLMRAGRVLLGVWGRR
jgi:hypothetical protein